MISQIIFALLLAVAGFFIFKRYQFVKGNILLGQKGPETDRKGERLKTMILVAFGQGKMFSRPFVALMHLILYVGFVVINIELIEIIVDGLTGEHRSFVGFRGYYRLLINLFEVLAGLVIIACVVFLIRRNFGKIKRFQSPEIKQWPKRDANIILITEILLMKAFLIMNAADSLLTVRSATPARVPSFWVSQISQPFLKPLSTEALEGLSHFCWWFHIVGILGFIVYLSYSKHLHILLAFPTTYFSKLQSPGNLSNDKAVTNEVKLMLDPNAVVEPVEFTRFGVKDVSDLKRTQLLSAYSCTECGRCTSACPANQTGKLLSPRKVMMDVRDRMEEIGNAKAANKGVWVDDGKSLIRDYISEEEVWACTTCNACTDACPININPMEVLVDLRRYLIMEESKSPDSITSMFNNVENNGAPWAMSAMNRADWTTE
ncbi:MAG: (Fe-S)-binding protein [Flavobacteriales bacterium]|nr:(Fe-S)-binding protein [Flavobacteriales bacterium]MDP4730841.1 (Fe-S)-binding protein [Flavobacteriales bacterium]MDP4817809.1 (Fe-S)-binding protein [Flavobacteriales bacterium]